MLEAGPWSYVVKLSLTHLPFLHMILLSLFLFLFFFFSLNPFYYYLLFFILKPSLSDHCQTTPQSRPPTLHERQIAHRSQILMNGCGSTKASFSPFLFKKTLLREPDLLGIRIFAC